MSLPLLPPFVPPEVRAMIYRALNDPLLAIDNSEVFFAMAPDFLRVLKLGKEDCSADDKMRARLVAIYPSSGRFVEQLTLYSDIRSDQLIEDFLQDFPLNNPRLKRLCIKSSPPSEFDDSPPYFVYLESLVAHIPTLTRLKFSGFSPSSSLIHAIPNLTRLDLGYLETQSYHITFPSRLEILSLSASMARFLIRPDHLSLRVLIVYTDDQVKEETMERLKTLIEDSPITKLGIVFRCKSSFLILEF